MDLASLSKEYFSNLNALAEKITADIENTQEAYQDLWHSLSKSDQNQAIDENIINPSAVIKYSNLPNKVSKQNYNAYSWFTKSQLNLFTNLDAMGYPDSVPVICRSDADQVSKLPESKIKEPKNESPVGNSNKSKSSLFGFKNTEEKSKTQSTSHKNTVLKPKTPPPPPPPKMSAVSVVNNGATDEDSEDKSLNDIPKTGFDFLDNW